MQGDQGEQEYPPGTVGYLARGLGRSAAAPRDLEGDWPAGEAGQSGALREPRLATPVPEQAPGSAEPGDVHTDEDDERGGDPDGDLRGRPGQYPARNSLFETFAYDVDDRESGGDPYGAARGVGSGSMDAAEAAAVRRDARRGAGQVARSARWVRSDAPAAEQARRGRNGGLGAGADPGAGLASARPPRRGRRLPPRSGWRRALYVASGRTVNLGEGRADRTQRELITRINQPLHGCYKIAMLSLKGGVGKTTVTATLGATYATLRGDRVIAVDANPDRGTLSQKIPLETTATVRHLLRDSQRVRRYADVRAYTSQAPSRLEVLASEHDPAVSEAFSEAEYRHAVNLLEHFYNVVLTDCGTGLMHSAMYGVLGLADALVVVSSGSLDGARSASATMDWLDAHGYGSLVANSVAVINSVRRNSGGVDLDQVAGHFAARCRAVVRIPFDPHLEEGAEIDLDRLAAGTRAALLELAAAVADNFSSSTTWAGSSTT